jgi:hypothetical protein
METVMTMPKPVSSSPALPIAHVVLRILIVLNWVMGAAILALLLVSPQRAMDHVRVQDFAVARCGAVIMGLRAIARSVSSRFR